MNFDKIGKEAFVKIYSESDKKVNLPLYFSRDMYDNEEGLNEIQLERGLKIQHLPSDIVSKEREIIYCAARSGAGKSYYSMKYIKEYKKKFKGRPIYLFTSLVEEDETLKELEVKKFKLDNNFLNTPLEIEFFKESLVLFDDIETITDKLVYKKIREILDKVLSVGRHQKTSCIYTSHILTNGAQTKLILNESHSIVIFPEGLPVRNIEYLCENYIGLNKKEIERVKKIKSRWICFFKSFPAIIAYESGLYIPSK